MNARILALVVCLVAMTTADAYVLGHPFLRPHPFGMFPRMFPGGFLNRPFLPMFAGGLMHPYGYQGIYSGPTVGAVAEPSAAAGEPEPFYK